jgi:hypothetical protein
MLGATIGYAQAAHRIVALIIFICLLLYAVQIVFGIAIRATLRRCGLTSLGAFAIGGLAMTEIPNAPYTVWSISKGHPLGDGVAYFALIGLYGAITGATFWAATRPDRAGL